MILILSKKDLKKFYNAFEKTFFGRMDKYERDFKKLRVRVKALED